MVRLLCFSLLLLPLMVAGEARASINCGNVVVIERSGPFTIIRNFSRPCSRSIIVVRPGAQVLVPDRRFGPDRHVHRKFGPPAGFVFPHRRFERRIIVPPLSVRPLFPPPRHRLMLRREWR